MNPSVAEGRQALARRGPTHRRLVNVALVVAFAGALLAPIWNVPYLPLVDYPNHLASAFVLAHLHDAALHFGQFYQADWNTYPYLAMDGILLALQRGVSIDLAGRLFLSFCVLSVPAAAWFFLHRANPGEESLALWSLLVANNLYFFRYGFLNLQLSMALCFFLLGLWLWHLERPQLGRWCLLLLVTTGLYFTHLVGFAVAAVVMTAYAGAARRPFRDLLSAWALYIPGALFYLHAEVGQCPPGAMQFRALTDKIGSLVAVMVGCSTPVDFLTLLVLLGVLAWVQIDNPGFQWNRPWRRATLILFLVYWLLPAVHGSATNVDKRLLPFVFVLSLSGAKVGRRARGLAFIALALFVVRAVALERYFVSVKPHLANLADAFNSVPRGARVLPLVDWANGAPQPERHFWAYGVITRGWVTPCLFHDPGVHALGLRERVYDPCGEGLTPSSHLDWGRVQRDFDYVWVYGLGSFDQPLSQIGRSVWEAGSLRIYRLQPAALAGPSSP